MPTTTFEHLQSTESIWISISSTLFISFLSIFLYPPTVRPDSTLQFSYQFFVNLWLDFCTVFLKRSILFCKCSLVFPPSPTNHFLQAHDITTHPIPSSQNKIIDHLPAFEAKQAVVKSLGLSVRPDQKPTALTIKIQACIEKNIQRTKRQKEVVNNRLRQSKKPRVSPPVPSPPPQFALPPFHWFLTFERRQHNFLKLVQNHWLGFSSQRSYLPYVWVRFHWNEVQNALDM